MKSMTKIVATALATASFACVAMPAPERIKCIAGDDDAVLDRNQDGSYKLSYSAIVGRIDRYKFEGLVAEESMQCRFRTGEHGSLLARCEAQPQDADVEVPKAGRTSKKTMQGVFEISAEYRGIETVAGISENVTKFAHYARGERTFGEMPSVKQIEARHTHTGEKVMLDYRHQFRLDHVTCYVTP